MKLKLIKQNKIEAQKESLYCIFYGHICRATITGMVYAHGMFYEE